MKRVNVTVRPDQLCWIKETGLKLSPFLQRQLDIERGKTDVCTIVQKYFPNIEWEVKQGEGNYRVQLGIHPPPSSTRGVWRHFLVSEEELLQPDKLKVKVQQAIYTVISDYLDTFHVYP